MHKCHVPEEARGLLESEKKKNNDRVFAFTPKVGLLGSFIFSGPLPRK